MRVFSIYKYFENSLVARSTYRSIDDMRTRRPGHWAFVCDGKEVKRGNIIGTSYASDEWWEEDYVDWLKRNDPDLL